MEQIPSRPFAQDQVPRNPFARELARIDSAMLKPIPPVLRSSNR
jgi:hypothetical protein